MPGRLAGSHLALWSQLQRQAGSPSAAEAVVEVEEAPGQRVLSGLQPPWSISLQEEKGCGIFHFVLSGLCWLEAPQSDRPVRLVQGDIVLLLHGSAHVVTDTPGYPPVPLEEMIVDCEPGFALELRFGGDGPQTVILSGAYGFDPGESHPVFAYLPALIHVAAGVAESANGTQTALRLLATELAEQRSGYQTVVNRLVDTVFIYIVRSWIEAQPEGARGWPAALRHPQIAEAICLLHRDVPRRWTIESLARAVGMSRSAFARDFKNLTGEAPVAYLTARRIEHAASLLERSSLSLAQIAERMRTSSLPAPAQYLDARHWMVVTSGSIWTTGSGMAPEGDPVHPVHSRYRRPRPELPRSGANVQWRNSVHGSVPEVSGNEMRSRAADSGVRLAELMAALSIATDLGMGQPLESALCSCVVAMRLGEALNLDGDTLRDVYYQALLRYIGCNADTYAMAALFGDELTLRHDFAAVDTGRPPEVLGLAMRYLRQANADEPPYRMAALVARGLLTLPRLMTESFAGHCEVGQQLAGRLGLGESLIVCLGQIYERWDGKGLPRKLKGDEVAPAVLLVTLAQDAVVWTRIGGADAAVATVRKRSGGAYPPAMAERFCEKATTILAGLDEEPTWESVLALEPGERDCLTDEEFDRSCEALADFADIKSPYTLGHSPGVAALAAGAGRRCGLIEADTTALRRAGLLHDVGRVGVSAGIWGKEGALSEREWEQVRLHAYYTERILARPEPLARLGALASQHHERMDGSGYHRGIAGQALSPAARILAAADAYHAMTEPRPHRPALSPEEAAEELRREVRAGRLDGDAVQAVLTEAGHDHPGGTRRARRERPAGLSEREIEVLRLMARGLSNRDMAEQLYLSPDTVKHHIQHIYNKIGLSTRAGATLFAMEHALL